MFLLVSHGSQKIPVNGSVMECRKLEVQIEDAVSEISAFSLSLLIPRLWVCPKFFERYQKLS